MRETIKENYDTCFYKITLSTNKKVLMKVEYDIIFTKEDDNISFKVENINHVFNDSPTFNYTESEECEIYSKMIAKELAQYNPNPWENNNEDLD